jgi:hypothetical protein
LDGSKRGGFLYKEAKERDLTAKTDKDGLTRIYLGFLTNY